MKKPDMHSYLEKIKPYVPGKPVEEVEREMGLTDVIKLASNENPLGPSPLAVEAMKNYINKMHIYPDGNAYYLREALSKKLDIQPDQLIFGNGSDELLSFMTLAYVKTGDETIMAQPSFSEYDFATRIMGAEPVNVPLQGEMFAYDPDMLLSRINNKTKIIFVCSPNNPTGTIIGKKELDYLVEKLPDGVFLVLDQAYLEYADDMDCSSGLEYIKRGLPVVAMRTFSKIYGLAGLRIGYGIAAKEIIAEMNRVREPFNVNAMAQAAAMAALQDEDHIEKSRKMVAKARGQLAEGFSKLNIKAIPDQANFCFVDLGVDSRKAFTALMKKGVIVRTGDIFGFPTYIRVTYGTEKQNERLLKALGEVLDEL